MKLWVCRRKCPRGASDSSARLHSSRPGPARLRARPDVHGAFVWIYRGPGRRGHLRHSEAADTRVEELLEPRCPGRRRPSSASCELHWRVPGPSLDIWASCPTSPVQNLSIYAKWKLLYPTCSSVRETDLKSRGRYPVIGVTPLSHYIITSVFL